MLRKTEVAKAMSTGRLEAICGKDSSGKTAMALAERFRRSQSRKP